MSFSNKNLPKYHIRYSQNFIFSSKLSKEVVDSTSINSQDKVIEIGPGKGSLTRSISAKCGTLTAIEQDYNLFNQLKFDFNNSKNTQFVHENFLEYELPANKKYKIIGNIPFAITADIIKKILDSKNPPTDTYLILQREAAFRFLGSSISGQNENLFSLRFKPFYTGKIIKTFRKTDFTPKPKVDVVMLHIRKLESPLVNSEFKIQYLDFVTYCLTAWKPNLGEVIKDLLSYYQIKDLYRSGIDFNSKPSEINYTEWLVLFNYFTKNAVPSKRKIINNAFNKLTIQQDNLIKSNRTRLAFQKQNKFKRHTRN